MTERVPHMEAREALLFDDGSLSVFADGYPVEKIRHEQADAGRNAPLAEWPKIIRVEFKVTEVLDDPASRAPPEPSEVERLRAENAALRARLNGGP